MSDRERWVIYPLLFLALGAALRDKFVDPTVAKRIVCEELTVMDDDPGNNLPPRMLASIRRDPQTGLGLLQLDGVLQVVDAEPAEYPLATPLIQIGRTNPGPGKRSFGLVEVSGNVAVHGSLSTRILAYILPTPPGVGAPGLLFPIQPNIHLQTSPAPESKQPAPTAKPPRRDVVKPGDKAPAEPKADAPK